jgi:hypothetical protein
MNGNGHRRKSATPTTAAANAADTSSFHPPPSFRLADDVAAESSRFELWTVRLPQAVDSDDINGLELSVSDPSSQNFESNGSKYTFQWGHPVENESFRLLLPKTKEEKKKEKSSDSDSDDDDSDDDDDERYYLYPTNIPFTKHVNVVSAVPLQAETDLAPRVENAPAALVPIRRAYQHVPPKKGLKRRWMPLGSTLTETEKTAGAGAVVMPSTPERKKVKTLPKTKSPARAPPSSPSVKAQSPSPPVAMNIKEEHIKEENMKEEQTSETKAEKSARKEAKKAKKEAKKMKKESKKVKEER